MTDSPVTKTAETVLAVAQVLREAGDSAYLPDVERALREAGLLVSGAPSEEQIERAARAAIEVLVAEFDGIDAPFDEADTAQALEMQRKAQRAALTAAGVGSPVPAQKAPPVELALDLWQALGFPVGEFDGYYERNGWADTWANLLHAPGGVNRRDKCGDEADGGPCVLRAGDHLVHCGESDVGTSEPLPSSISPVPVQVDEAKLLAFLESPTHAPPSHHSGADGSCIECPWQVGMLPGPDLARELSEWLRGGAQ